MTYKLLIDLISHWFIESLKNIHFLIVLVLLTLPISALFNFQLIESSYLDAKFAGLSANSQMLNAVLYEDKKTHVIEPYITEEIEHKWSDLQFVYERSTNVEVIKNNNKQSRDISFFSGGYDRLKLNPVLGSLKKMEFPHIGQELVTALSYQYWVDEFSADSNIIGSHIIANNKAVTIVAVMPKNFISFRKNQSTQLIMPYVQLPSIMNHISKSITPDTYSYLLGPPERLFNMAGLITKYLQEEALILDESKIVFSRAIGVNSQHYFNVSTRIGVLKSLFLLLLVFCFIAFITFYIGEYSVKQQEYSVRSLCGGSNKQLFMQRIVDIFLTVFLLTLICLFIIPMGKYAIQSFFPELIVRETSWELLFLFKVLAGIFIAATLLMSVIFVIQDKLIKTYTGRGQSASTSQKIQNYALLALTVSITSLAIYVSSLLMQSQQTLYNTHIGFSSENRFIVTFDIPKNSNKTFYADNSAELLLEQLTSQTEIKQAAITSIPPLSERTSFGRWATVLGVPIGTSQHSITYSDRVSPQYFTTLNAHIKEGKSISWQNRNEIVVNQTLWDMYFKGQTLVTAQLLSIKSDGEKVPSKIVGIVEDIYFEGPDTPPVPIIYSPILVITGFESLIIESDSSIHELTKLVNKTLKKVNVVFTGIKINSISELVKKEHAPRKAVLIVTLFGTAIIFISSAIFCYNTINQITHKNAREFSVRFSSGARLHHLVKTEFQFFIIVLSPTIFVVAYIYIQMRHVLSDYVVNIDLVNPLLFAFILFTLISILSGILMIKIKQKTQQAWAYLF